jgi:hypothetical protein
MNEEDAELWNRLVEMANKVSDGHLTVMKFKTNWRVGFFTPNEQRPRLDAGGQDLCRRSAHGTGEPRHRTTSDWRRRTMAGIAAACAEIDLAQLLLPARNGRGDCCCDERRGRSGECHTAGDELAIIPVIIHDRPPSGLRPPLPRRARFHRQSIALSHVRFGSKTDIASRRHDVRFTPESGHYLRAHIYSTSESGGPSGRCPKTPHNKLPPYKGVPNGLAPNQNACKEQPG